MLQIKVVNIDRHFLVNTNPNKFSQLLFTLYVTRLVLPHYALLLMIQSRNFVSLPTLFSLDETLLIWTMTHFPKTNNTAFDIAIDIQSLELRYGKQVCANYYIITNKNIYSLLQVV